MTQSVIRVRDVLNTTCRHDSVCHSESRDVLNCYLQDKHKIMHVCNSEPRDVFDVTCRHDSVCYVIESQCVF